MRRVKKKKKSATAATTITGFLPFHQRIICFLVLSTFIFTCTWLSLYKRMIQDDNDHAAHHADSVNLLPWIIRGKGLAKPESNFLRGKIPAGWNGPPFTPSSSSMNFSRLIDKPNKTEDFPSTTDDAPGQLTRPWSYPIIHVVNTRFMQSQGNLLALGRARLVLFQTFCLPTMINQTIMEAARNEYHQDDPSFLWIIKVDPNLHPMILLEMEKLLQPYPNFYLVGSNINYGIGVHSGGWRGGEAGNDVLKQLEQGRLYTGDLNVLKRAHEYRNERIVLETRLDADDGLNIRYLEVVQKEAIRMLSSGESTEKNDGNVEEKENEEKAKWIYWCAMNRIEWNPTPTSSSASSTHASPVNATTNHNQTITTTMMQDYGSFIPRRNIEFCVTPGITLGSSVGVSEQSLPRYPHENLIKKIHKEGSCGLQSKKECIHLMNEPFFSVVRSRTPTSAGMKNVAADESQIDPARRMAEEALASKPEMILAMWRVLNTQFAITMRASKEANQYIQQHLTEIVLDNLSGQCTKGHSCKVSSMDALQRMLDLAGEGTVGNVRMAIVEEVEAH